MKAELTLAREKEEGFLSLLVEYQMNVEEVVVIVCLVEEWLRKLKY